MSTSSLAAALAAAAVVAALRAVVGPVALGTRARLVGFGASNGPLAPRAPDWFARRAAAADLVPAERWWSGGVGAAAFAAAMGWVSGGPLPALLAGAGVSGAGLGLLWGLRRRRDDRVARSVPETLEVVARSCRSGASLGQALRGLAADSDLPAAAVLGEVGRRVDDGVALREALDEVVERHPVASLRLAAAALLVAADTGAAPARAVEGVAASLRDDAAVEREAAAHATQARASAAVLVVAPVGFGAMAVVTDPRVGEFLFRTPTGVACLVAGAALDVVGAWWMSRLVESVR